MDQIESLPRGTAVVHFSNASFVSPWPELRTTPTRLALLALAAAAVGHLRAAALAGVEADMAKEARRRARTPPEGRALRWAPVGREHLDADPGYLAPARTQGLPAYDTGEGMIYAPDPYRGNPGMVDKETDALPDGLADVAANLSYRALTEKQSEARTMADDYLRRAKGGDRAAAHTAKRILLRLHREIVVHADAQAALNAVRAAGAPARLWRRQMVAGRRAVLETKDLPRAVRLAALWRLRCALRAPDMQEWLDAPQRAQDDGLRSLFANKHLALDEYLEGLSYRRLFVATERSLGSAINFDRVGGGNQPLSKLVARGDLQLERKRLEAIVMGASRNGRGLNTLRRVAGQGMTLNAISARGKSSDRIVNRKALVLALRALVDRPREPQTSEPRSASSAAVSPLPGLGAVLRTIPRRW